MQRQGRFCLSDDSHGIAQVATNYEKLLPFLERNRIETLWFLTHDNSHGNSDDPRYPNLIIGSIPVSEVAGHAAFKGS